MNAILDYARSHWAGCAFAAVLVLVALYWCRRYTIPALLLAVEFAVYCAVIHVVLHGVVRVAAWFKYESQMKFLVEEKEQVPWQTPLTRFWDTKGYDPAWMFYIELALLVGVIILMLRYRPMRIQKVRPRSTPATKGMAQGYDWKTKSASWKGKK